MANEAAAVDGEGVGADAAPDADGFAGAAGVRQA